MCYNGANYNINYIIIIYNINYILKLQVIATVHKSRNNSIFGGHKKLQNQNVPTFILYDTQQGY